jgi:peptide/nickel transport system permease protein
VTVLQPTLPAVPRRRFASRLGAPAWGAVAVIVVIVVMAIAAPLLAPSGENDLDLLHMLAAPSGGHPFGTDAAGRDVLTRVMFGARTSLLGPLGVIVISLTLGVALGLLSAARGGVVDGLIGRGVDLMLSFPTLLFAILAVALFGSGFTTSILALAIAYTPAVVRLTRSLALTEQEREYVAAYRVAGFGATAIYRRHVLPNIGGVIFAHSVVQFGYALMDLAVLSFLGFGVQPPASDWGSMVSEGQPALLDGKPWESLFAGGAIVVAILAFNIAGSRLGDLIGGDDE